MKKIFILSIVALLTLSINSCDKYLDINVDPTAPSESDLNTSLLLPALEMNLASSYGNYLRIVGGYFSEE